MIGEGAKPLGGDIVIKRRVANSPDPIRLGGISHQVAAQLEGLLNIEARVTILGHLLRGGSPTAYDRILATRFGAEAMHKVAAGISGQMICLKGTEVSTVPILDVAGKIRRVSPEHPWVRTAMSVGNFPRVWT